MNQSRGEISAETVALTNEPLLQHQQRQQQHLNNHHHPINISSSYFNTQSIHQQLNPSTALPSLLARSLVAFSDAIVAAVTTTADQDKDDDQDQLLQTTATDKQLHLQQQLQQQQQHEEQSFGEWWGEYWSRQPFPSGYTQSSITLLACLITTIIFLIVVGNLLVCIAIFTEKSLKPTQNWFIASLAVSDMLLGLVVMPFSLARELMGFWIFGPLWCDIHEAIDVLLTTASINTLCLISLDRYWSITQAVSYLKKRTPRRGAFMIAFVWIFSAAVSLPPLFGWKKQSPTIIANSSSPSNFRHQQNFKQLQQQQQQQQQQHRETSKPYALTTSTTMASAGQWDESARDRKRKRHTQVSISSRIQELAMPIFVERRDTHPLLMARRPSKATSPEEDVGETTIDDELIQDQNQEQFISNTMKPLISALTQSPVIMTTTSGTNLLAQTTTDQTTEYPSCQLSDDIGYVLYSALGSFYIPCAVMVFTYIKIFLAARSRARRAINKQSRGNAAANKRIAARRTNQVNFSAPNAGQGSGSADAKLLEAETSLPVCGGLSAPISSCGSTTMISKPPVLASAQGGQQYNNQENANSSKLEQQQHVHGSSKQVVEPMMKGKIVIVERKKSIAGGPLVQILPPKTEIERAHQHHHQINKATYTCSNLVAELQTTADKSTDDFTQKQQTGEKWINNSTDSLQQPSHKRQSTGGSIRLKTPANSDEGPCTLTMSDAKQASPSALNSSASNDSSVITVMNESMAGMPITRFQFHSCPSVELDTKRWVPQNGTSLADNESRKAAALLKAISQAGAHGEDDNLLKDVLSTSDGSTDGSEGEWEKGNNNNNNTLSDIVVESRDDTRSPTSAMQGDNDKRLMNSSKLMAIEIDNGNQVDSTSINTTNETCFMSLDEDSEMFDAQAGRTIMMIAGKASQKQVYNLGKTSGIMMTMMPASGNNHQTQTDIATSSSNNNNNQHTVICNNMACRHLQHQHQTAPTRSASSYCDSSMTINDEDGLDDCVDDELLTDDCNGYSVSCGLDQYCQVSGVSMICSHCHECEQLEQMSSSNRHLSMSESPTRKQHATNRPHTHRRSCPSEAQSMTGDDNLSLTEYRSNDDSSSIMGHDVLDATEAHKSEKKKSIFVAPGTSSTGDRKKSSIGMRLARLGSSTPLTIQSGGLLALATNQQQQQQQSGGGTRNLKALRQNFFLKLNQLTAKHNENKSKRPTNQTSPIDKSSAQSSGTSYEPSVDCATTSNIHSIEYHQETTVGKVNDYGKQTSGESQDLSSEHPTEQPRADSKPPMMVSQQNCELTKLPGELVDRKNSPASDKRFSQSAGVNNQIIDKNDDRALLLQDPQRGEDSNRRLLNANSTNAISTNNNNKSPRFDEQQQQQQRSKKQVASGGHMNRSSTVLSSSAGTCGSGGANRAYLASDNERHKRKLAKARERRATLILGLIMAAFICSWLPFFTFYVLRALCTVCREYIPPRIEAFVFWAGYCNSAINPIIYTIFNRDFRKAFRKILFKCL